MDINEAKDVIGNKQNPLYERFWKNDPSVKSEVDRAFSAAYPGEQELGGGDIPDHINEALNKEVAASGQRGTQQQTGENDPVVIALRADPDFGRDYDRNVERARNALVEIFGDRKDLVERYDQNLSHQEKIQAMKLLAKVKG